MRMNQRTMSKCPNCGIEIPKNRPKIRSNQHNKFFFATIIDPLAEFTGESSRKTYEALKIKLLPAEKGKIVPTGTSEMTDKELIAFTILIEGFALDFLDYTYDNDDIQAVIDYYAETR